MQSQNSDVDRNDRSTLNYYGRGLRMVSSTIFLSKYTATLGRQMSNKTRTGAKE